MLTTLDQITGGRVICSVGSGWFLDEYGAYDVPLIDDHDERVEYAREVIRVLKHLWTHPAPEITDFDGRYVHIKGLGFNPAPYQKPHPPIWVGGDSDATLDTGKELADGWVTLASGNERRLAEVTSASDWPKRPIEIIKTIRIYVAPTRDAALDEVAEVVAKGGPFTPTSVEEFVDKEVVGTPSECVARLKEFESWGVTTVRTTCDDAAHQERVATLVLPNFAQ
jgi:alkanesulfonate monooxygenase SsuD/methylene tetrahydromethanopterin reductase-like flavin-dependent oxidoreductase (luciferase family)